MSKSSRWLRGHDDPAAVNEPVPLPAEVMQDIEALDAWRREVHAVHNS
jgi:hypothetical protein